MKTLEQFTEEAFAAFWREVSKLPPLPEGKCYSAGEPEYTRDENGWHVTIPVVIKDLYEV